MKLLNQSFSWEICPVIFLQCRDTGDITQKRLKVKTVVCSADQYYRKNSSVPLLLSKQSAAPSIKLFINANVRFENLKNTIFPTVHQLYKWLWLLGTLGSPVHGRQAGSAMVFAPYGQVNRPVHSFWQTKQVTTPWCIKLHNSWE